MRLFRRLSVPLLGLALLTVCVFLGLAPAQVTPGLQISSPATGTVVYPGQVVSFVVTPVGGAVVAQVVIAGEPPIGFSDVQTTQPFQPHLTIPTNIAFRRYQVTATGVTPTGQVLSSASISIDVESISLPVSLQIEPNVIKLRFFGDQLPVSVYGVFAGGSIADMTESSTVTYGSSNPAIATVSSNGMVTAVGQGNASIIINGIAIPVSVATGARGDLNGDGKIDLDDLRILQDALNTPATKPFDARDLNGDGVINALDARILVTLCTNSGCAVR